MDAVPNVNHWDMLGQGLGLSQPVLDAIRLELSVQGIPRMKTEMFSRWLARDPEASWTKLEAALRRMGEITEADGVKKLYLGGAKAGGTAAQQPGEFCELLMGVANFHFWGVVHPYMYIISYTQNNRWMTGAWNR